MQSLRLSCIAWPSRVKELKGSNNWMVKQKKKESQGELGAGELALGKSDKPPESPHVLLAP